MKTKYTRLSGKVAIVTGASKGIGAAIARALGAEGASVVVNFARSEDSAKEVASEINRCGGQAIAVRADVSRQTEIEALFAQTMNTFHRLDILVNNAGVYQFAPLGEITEDHFRAHFGLNVLGLLLATQAAVNLFGPEGGSVVNISSLATILAPPNSSVYTATKASVEAITKVLAKELGPRQIRVNSVSPGLIETEGTRAAGFASAEAREKIAGLTPMGRIGEPDEIASAVVFLASSESSWITGETIAVAGGMR